ncbi:hypothetical protein BD769DRAFT_1696380 [Suillus cothurnatus]|nr:hypothetical protein BD769DRAFT_1696380 [Suillus cothurnatus]
MYVVDLVIAVLIHTSVVILTSDPPSLYPRLLEVGTGSAFQALPKIKRKPGQNKEMRCTYEVKADGLRDLHITTEDRLFQLSRTMPPQAWRTFLLVRTWTRHLLELPDPADDTESMEDLSVSECSLPPSENEPVYSECESHSRALRLIVRLGQPFGAFLLARQRGGEYKRIASDRNIIAQVKDMASVGDMMHIRTLEIMCLHVFFIERRSSRNEQLLYT